MPRFPQPHSRIFSRAIPGLMISLLFLLSGNAISLASDSPKIPVKSVEPFYQQITDNTPPIYQPQVTYLSLEKAAPIQFSSIGATWEQSIPTGTSIKLEIRLKNQGKYSNWYELDPSIDQKDNSTLPGPQSSFLSTSLADGYQYRITLNSQVASVTPVLDNLKFTFINGGSPGQKTELLLASREPATAENTDEFLPTDFQASDYQANLLASTALARPPELSPSVAPVAKDGHAKDGLPAQPATPIISTELLAQAESPTVNTLIQRNQIKVPVRTNKTSTFIPGLPVQPGTPVTNSALPIISRAAWGADESIRLYHPTDSASTPAKLVPLEDNYYTTYASELKESLHISTDASGNQLTWPLSYPQSIRKIVIHHTATTVNLDDPKKAIRDIYIWHTLSKGWGDIGYNYIIDQQGNIYEGRFGGEMVVGAHAGRGNFGSIGIAVLGNFQDSNPPEAVVTALTALIKEKAQLYNIDTEGASLFRGVNYPNIMGHRDIMSTSCPGDRLYAMLPIIRKLAKVESTTITAGQSAATGDFGWTTNAAPVVSINPNSKKTVSLTIKNVGKNILGKATYFQITPNQNAKTFLRNSEKILTGTLGTDLAPGQTTQIKLLLNSTATSGSAILDLQPVINGKLINKHLSFGLQVFTPPPKPKFDYDLLSIIYNKTIFNKGDLIAVTVKLRNTGTAPWQKTGNNRLQLGADKSRDHLNNLLTTPSTRLGGLTEDLVQFGQIGTFTFQIKVPNKDGIYKEYFTPVVEGIQWMTNHDTFIQIKVGNSDQLITTAEEDNDGGGIGSIQTATALARPPELSPSVAPVAKDGHAKDGLTSTSPTAGISGGSSINIATTKLDINENLRKIRIDLSYRGNPATISADGLFALYQGVTKIASFPANQKVTLEYKNGAFLATASGQTYQISAKPRFVPAIGTILSIDNWNHLSGGSINYNQYRGTLEGIVYNGELHFVNELNMEDYLRGLAEENDIEPPEKIKAMMVIARTYARFYMEVAKKFPGAPFDLNDDPQYSQKYLGYAYETRMPLTASQVGATAAQYVTYNGYLIKTPYFSSTDGTRTISALLKWGWTDAPFLTSVDDSMCRATAFNGHGVGLSGCGANALANQGKTYDQIIKYYYQGTAITQANY